MPGKKGSRGGSSKEDKLQSREYVFYWQKERKRIADEYEQKRKGESARYYEELDRVRKSAEAERKAAAEKRRAVFEESRINLSNDYEREARKVFPMPRIVLVHGADGEESFKLGKNDRETAAKIAGLSAAAVRTTVSPSRAQDPVPGEVTVTSISFTKADASSVNFIKNDVRIRRGKPVSRTKAFTKMQDAIIAFDAFFTGRTDIGEDYRSSEAYLTEMVTRLQAVAATSKRYFETHSSYRFSDAGKQRVQMAKNTYAMAMSKLAAIEAAWIASEDAEKDLENRRRDFVNAGLDEMSRRNEKEGEREQEEIGKRLEEAERRILEDHIRSERALEAQKEDELKPLEAERRRSQKYLAYGALSSGQKFAVNNAKFSKVLFEEKHNPFAAYREEVPMGKKPDEIPMDPDHMKDAVPLEDLMRALEKNGSQIRATYNVDALITLSNLQLYDSMTGAVRAKNDYRVTFEFVKTGDDGTPVRLPASALAEKGGFEKLAEEGYTCFITGIKADFIKGTGNVYGPGSSFTIAERSMIPLETVTRIAGLAESYPETDIFWEASEDKSKKEDDPAQALGAAFRDLKTLLLRRSGGSMIGDSPYEWQKFNVISTKALMKDIASDNIDFRPVRPDGRLKNRTFHRSGLTAANGGANYFDQRLMENLGANTAEIIEKGYKFEEEFASKLLSDESLVLSAESLRNEALDNLIENPAEAPEVRDIASLMKEVTSMKSGHVLKYDTRYLTKDGVLEEPPEDEAEFMISETCENQYDLKAAELYTAITRYVKAHKEDLKDVNSPAFLFDQWKNKAYPGSGRFGEKGPDAVIINAAASEGEDDLTFDGDGDYLCGAELSFKGTDYWNSDDKELNALYGADRREFYMKDFRDAPLFTRLPSASDIRQGKLGNCYFLAAVTAAIASDPSSIKDMMQDNGDGTVTCRFNNDKNQPVFVTVNKTVPYVRCPDGEDPSKPGALYDIPATGEKAPLWYHILLKGYILSGLRSLEDLSEKDRQSAMKTFGANSSQGKNAPDDLKARVMNVRFKNSANKDEQAAKASDKLYSRVINHTPLVMDGGLSANVYRHFTGNKARGRSIPSSSGRETIAALRSVDIDSNCFCADRLAKKGLSSADREVLKDICARAADRLTLEKTRYSKDLNGKDFVITEKINMDDLLDAMKEAASDLEESGPAVSGSSGPMAVFELFSEAMIDHQLNDPRPEKVFASPKAEKYSAYANTTFDVIKAHLGKNHGVTCSFHSLGDAGKNEVELPGSNLYTARGGMVSEHAFTVLGCGIEKGKKLLYIRNPWGRKEKAAYDVSMVTSEGKTETVSYTSLTEDDERTRESGVFKMELSEFMEFGKDMTFLPKGPSLKYDEVVKNLSARYLKVIEKQNPVQYRKMIEAHGYDAVLEKTKESDLIREYADEVFEIDDIAKDGEDGKIADQAELKKIEKFKEELNSVFGQARSKESVLTESPAVKEGEAIGKGGSVI